jgi:hypothetical protein
MLALYTLNLLYIPLKPIIRGGLWAVYDDPARVGGMDAIALCTLNLLYIPLKPARDPARVGGYGCQSSPLQRPKYPKYLSTGTCARALTFESSHVSCRYGWHSS